jgi:2-hydroxy-3-keto-5-methylthiopentenyl-1-phosphate phosphatase
VGNLVFTKFGDADYWWDLVEHWKRGEIDGRDLWRKQAAVSKMKPAELDEFAASQKLDPHFSDFVDFCRQHNFPVYVCSDGMDAYISRILKHHNLADLTVCSNHLEIAEDGTLAIDFPYYEFGCGQCANCKGYHVRLKKQPGEKTVYIGDGNSDKCGAIEADIVFAKKDLLDYCREKNIDCFSFDTFQHVQDYLTEML